MEEAWPDPRMCLLPSNRLFNTLSSAFNSTRVPEFVPWPGSISSRRGRSDGPTCSVWVTLRSASFRTRSLMSLKLAG